MGWMTRCIPPTWAVLSRWCPTPSAAASASRWSTGSARPTGAGHGVSRGFPPPPRREDPRGGGDHHRRPRRGGGRRSAAPAVGEGRAPLGDAGLQRHAPRGGGDGHSRSWRTSPPSTRLRLSRAPCGGWRSRAAWSEELLEEFRRLRRLQRRRLAGARRAEREEDRSPRADALRRGGGAPVRSGAAPDLPQAQPDLAGLRHRSLPGDAPWASSAS